MLAFAIVIFNQKLIWQLCLMAFQIVTSVIILGRLKPFKTREKRQIEIFNEIILMVVMYTIMCFSSWIPDAATRFNVGYVCIVAIAAHLAVNFQIIGISTYRKIKMMLRLKMALRNYIKARE